MPDVVRNVTLTLLCDNSVAAAGVRAEHGFSVHVQADGQSFLFDTGASGLFLENAARLGVDLSETAAVILSHGHYDHTGGLAALLSAHGPQPIVAHPQALSAKYSRPRSGVSRAIGLPESKRRLMQLGAAWRLSTDAQELAPGIMTTGEITRTTDFEPVPAHFAVTRDRVFVTDTFADEQALLLRTSTGLVIITGCAHRGLISTLDHALALTGESRVRAVIGGTHLAGASALQVARTREELRARSVAQVVACHCTGFGPAAALRGDLGESFSPGGVGARFDF